ncbi:hypothetical protein NHQ30_000454 [Ciborinia camelliae]|nr:hypothetical protein NHQ30_000454 [Ciborinia camelliae]
MFSMIFSDADNILFVGNGGIPGAPAFQQRTPGTAAALLPPSLQSLQPDRPRPQQPPAVTATATRQQSLPPNVSLNRGTNIQEYSSLPPGHRVENLRRQQCVRGDRFTRATSRPRRAPAQPDQRPGSNWFEEMEDATYSRDDSQLREMKVAQDAELAKMWAELAKNKAAQEVEIEKIWAEIQDIDDNTTDVGRSAAEDCIADDSGDGFDPP